MSGWKSTTLRKYGNRPKIIGDTDVPLCALGGFYCSSIASFGGTPAWTQICTNHQLILKHKPKGSALQAFKGCNWGETSDGEQQEKPKITKHRKIWSCRDRYWDKSYNYAGKLFSVRYLKISTANNFALICDFDIRAVAPSIWNQSFRILLTQSILDQFHIQLPWFLYFHWWGQTRLANLGRVDINRECQFFYRTSHSINNSPGLPLLQGNQVQM